MNLLQFDPSEDILTLHNKTLSIRKDISVAENSSYNPDTLLSKILKLYDMPKPVKTHFNEYEVYN